MTSYKPDPETARLFARHKQATEVLRETKGPVGEAIEDAIRQGATSPQLAGLTGMSTQAIRNIAERLGVDIRVKAPTVGREVEAARAAAAAVQIPTVGQTLAKEASPQSECPEVTSVPVGNSDPAALGQELANSDPLEEAEKELIAAFMPLQLTIAKSHSQTLQRLSLIRSNPNLRATRLAEARADAIALCSRQIRTPNTEAGQRLVAAMLTYRDVADRD